MSTVTSYSNSAGPANMEPVPYNIQQYVHHAISTLIMPAVKTLMRDHTETTHSYIDREFQRLVLWGSELLHLI